jgi:hypothetical protein
MFAKQVSIVLSLTAVSFITSTMSAQADTPKPATAGTVAPEPFSANTSTATPTKSDSALSLARSIHLPTVDAKKIPTQQPLTLASQPAVTPAKSDSVTSPVDNVYLPSVDAKETPNQSAKALLGNVQPSQLQIATQSQLTPLAKHPDANQIAQPRTKVADDNLFVQPVPSNFTTSAAALNPEPSTSLLAQTATTAQERRVAQTDINLGRPTQSGSSYLGIAGNFGLNGSNSALGDTNFTIISKIGLTRNFSVRPAAVLGDNTTILIPITYDYTFAPGNSVGPLAFAPYIGAGVAIDTGRNSDVNFMATGGIDVPLTSKFTATAGVNVDFANDTSVGVLIGVGYNFIGF